MKKYYRISEDDLKELLYNTEVLNCLDANGVDNWIGYMDNKERYIKNVLNNATEDSDFEDIVEVELAKYEVIPNEIIAVLGSDNLDYIEEQFNNYEDRLIKEMKGE